MNFGKEIIDPRNFTYVSKLFNNNNDKIKLITIAYNYSIELNYLLEIATGTEYDPVSARADVYNITKNDQDEVIVQTLGGTSIITGLPKQADVHETIGQANELPTYELLISFFKIYVNDITQIAVYNNIGQTVLIKRFRTNSFGKTHNSLKNITIDIKYLENKNFTKNKKY